MAREVNSTKAPPSRSSSRWIHTQEQFDTAHMLAEEFRNLTTAMPFVDQQEEVLTEGETQLRRALRSLRQCSPNGVRSLERALLQSDSCIGSSASSICFDRNAIAPSRWRRHLCSTESHMDPDIGTAA